MTARVPVHARPTPRLQRLAGLALAAACTSNQPPAKVEAEPEPAPTPVSDPDDRELLAMFAVDGQRALFVARDDKVGGAFLSLAGSEGPPIWTFQLATTSSWYSIPTPQVSAGVVTVPWQDREEYLGTIGLDLETGAERWRTSVVAADPTMADARLIHTFGDAAERIDVVAVHDRTGVLALDPATGAYRWITSLEARGWNLHRPILAPGHLIFAAGRADPDDPDNTDENWHFIRRSDGERVFMIGGAEAACVVDRHFYVQRDDKLAAVDLRAPTPTFREVLPRIDMPGLAGPGRMIACREYAGAPVLISRHEHRASQVVGLDAAGAVAWRVSLGDRHVEREDVLFTDGDPIPRTLTRFVPLVATSGLAATLMVVDLQEHRVAGELLQNLPQWFDADLYADDGRYLLSMGVGEDRTARLGEPDRFTRLYASIDGATGLIDAATQVVGALPLETDHIVDGTLWLAADDVGPDSATPRVRLGLATLVAAGAPPPTITLPDGAEAVKEALLLPDGGPPWRTRDRVPADFAVPKATPQPQPASRRTGPGPTAPTWDRAPIDAEAARGCDAPAAPRAELMAWQVRAGDRGWPSEQALVSLEYDDRERGHVWCLALVTRSGGRDAWRVYHGSSHAPLRRRILRHRPTNADVYKLLDHGYGWMFLDDRDSWTADGDIMDAAWQAVTGEPPTRFLVHRKP